MKQLLVVLILATSCNQALAIGRYNVAGMECRKVQATVAREGAAILRYPSKKVPGLVLYDRYVSNGSYCESNRYAAYATVPTRDNRNCPVYRCHEQVDDRFFF